MAKPQIAKSQVKKEANQKAKQERAETERARRRQGLMGQIGLYAAIAVVLLVAAYWGYSKMTEKVSWTSVAILPSPHVPLGRSEEHTSELQSHSEISYAVFCLKKKK